MLRTVWKTFDRECPKFNDFHFVLTYCLYSMTFREVKAHAIYFLLELEKLGKITRMDGYQGILNAIAGDVRSKNRRRVQRLHEKESLEESLKHLAERKKYFEEQIRQYHDYVETAMNTMQRGKGCVAPTWRDAEGVLLMRLFAGSDVSCRSRSSTSICESSRNKARCLSSARTSTVRSDSTTRVSYCRSRITRLDNLTSSTLLVSIAE